MGLCPTDYHPRRYIRWARYRHRGCRSGCGGGTVYRCGDIPRARLGPVEERDDRRRRPNRRGDASCRRLGLGGRLSYRTTTPQKLAAEITSFTDNKYVVLALLNVLFLVLGLFLHSAAAIILVVPVVIPLVNAYGIDPVHFGLIVTLNLGIGQQTPPVASVLVTACSVAKTDIWEVSKVNINFIMVLFVILMMVTYIPAIPMSLVELFYR